MSTQQNDALQCAADLEYSIPRHRIQDAFILNAYKALKMVRTQHARIADLEAQLESIGAGGVSGPPIGQPQAMPDLSQLTERGAVAWADSAPAVGYPPLPNLDGSDEQIWEAISNWKTATPGADAVRKANKVENAIIGTMRACVDADRAARAPADSVTEMENLQRTAVGWQERALRAERNWVVCRRWAIAGGAPVEKLGDDPDQPFHAASPAIEGESNV